MTLGTDRRQNLHGRRADVEKRIANVHEVTFSVKDDALAMKRMIASCSRPRWGRSIGAAISDPGYSNDRADGAAKTRLDAGRAGSARSVA